MNNFITLADIDKSSLRKIIDHAKNEKAKNIISNQKRLSFDIINSQISLEKFKTVSNYMKSFGIIPKLNIFTKNDIDDIYQDLVYNFEENNFNSKITPHILFNPSTFNLSPFLIPFPRTLNMSAHSALMASI